jgi:lysophospholipase L1-like esterase
MTRRDFARIGAGIGAGLYVARNAFAAVTVLPTDTNWYFSPYNVYSDGAGSMQSNNIRASSTLATWVNCGAYFKMRFSGTSAVLNISSAHAGMGLRWSIDNGAQQSYSTSGGDTSVTLATGLAGGNHTVVLWQSATPEDAARWVGNPPVQSLTITSMTLDNGASTSALSGSVETALRVKNILFYGDSITEGFKNLGASFGLASQDAAYTWADATAQGFLGEYGNCAFDGQSWTTTQGNVPAFPSTWDLYFTAKSRLFTGKLSPIPDYVFICMGRNDSASCQSAATTWLANIRAACNPTTPVFVVVPFVGTQQANLTAAVAAAADPYVYLIDIVSSGGQLISGLRWSSDGVHPYQSAQTWLGAMVTKSAQAAIGGSGNTGCGVTLSGGVVLGR